MRGLSQQIAFLETKGVFREEWLVWGGGTEVGSLNTIYTVVSRVLTI